MKRWLQRGWVIDIVEGAPSIVFLALWRSDVDMQFAGWIGVALAAIQLCGFRYFGLRNNPLMLGINVHLLLITPLIMTAFHVGARDLSDTLVAYSYRGVLVTVFLVGCALTLFSPRGFVGVDNLRRIDRLKHSTILLAASALAILWGFTFNGSTAIAVAAPLIGLFSLRRFLVSRELDRDIRLGALIGATAGAQLSGRSNADSI